MRISQWLKCGKMRPKTAYSFRNMGIAVLTRIEVCAYTYAGCIFRQSPASAGEAAAGSKLANAALLWFATGLQPSCGGGFDWLVHSTLSTRDARALVVRWTKALRLLGVVLVLIELWLAVACVRHSQPAKHIACEFCMFRGRAWCCQLSGGGRTTSGHRSVASLSNNWSSLDVRDRSADTNPSRRLVFVGAIGNGGTLKTPKLFGLREVRLVRSETKVTWLILPVVICSSQRLSHACLSIRSCTPKLRMAH